jgi:hypothetical protein
MPRKLKYQRKITPGEKVRVYRNLNNGMISVMDTKGQVIAHVAQIALINAKFVVRQAGRERVLKNKKKNVHAFVVGNFWFKHNKVFNLLGDIVKYNPYKYSSFVKEDETPIYVAGLAVIDKTGKIYV